MLNEETIALLNDLVEAYGNEKALADSYKKSSDIKNNQIKDILRDSGDEEFVGDTYTVKFSSYTKDSFNEELAIKTLKQQDIPEDVLSKIIVTKEVIDTDALESFMYNGTISPSVSAALSKCVEQKLVETLRVSKSKAKKPLNE